MNTTYGIDVSKWNGVINWNKVKAAGKDFAFVRLGYCGYGGDVTLDPMFHANAAGALAAGLGVGAYLFSYAQNAAAAQAAAADTLDLIQGYQITYPVVFDMEDSTSMKYSSMSRADNTAIAGGYLSIIEDAGYYAMLYASRSFLTDCLDMGQLPYDVWVAQWGEKCTYPESYGIWQYSETGRVDGIDGNVDLNIAYKDYPSIIQDNGLNQWDEVLSTDIEAEEPPDAEEEEVLTYTVVKNDTLTRISKKHGVPLMQLIKANPQIKNPDLIYVGDILHIPAKL